MKGEDMLRKKIKCFTLMELLVVIAVIALLLAVLMPSLRRAKEMAGRVVCGHNERQLAAANHLYANSWDEQFCPPMMENEKMPDAPEPLDKDDYREVNWLTNPEFRKYMALDDKQVDTSRLAVMPDEYFCPADKVARYDWDTIYGVLASYGYNVAEWYYPTDVINDYWPKGISCPKQPWQIGHKRTAVPRASEKINFTDSVDWWVTWNPGADYANAWDLLGQVPAHPPKQPNYDEDASVYGPVIYRHNEGANFAFYDGHVEHLNKKKVYIEEEDVTPLKDKTGMWFVNYDAY
jgi:prepilin-type processing-associated H-X9-DG protein